MSQRLASVLAIVGLVVVVLIALTNPALAVAPPSSNLVLWLNPDSLVTQGYTNGQNITYWPDSSGNNHSAVDRLGWAPPKFSASGINGVPAVTFGTSGNDAFFIADGATGTSNGTNLTPINLGSVAGLTIAVVFKTIANQPGNNFLLGNAAQSWDFGVHNGVARFDRYNNTSDPPGPGWVTITGTATLNTVVPPKQGHYIIATHSNPAGPSDFASIYTDGLLDAGPTLVPYNSATDLARIGQGAGGGGQVFNGLISEVLVYSTELSTGDRAQLSTYLAERYSVPEPASLALLAGGAALMLNRRRGVNVRAIASPLQQRAE